MYYLNQSAIKHHEELNEQQEQCRSYETQPFDNNNNNNNQYQLPPLQNQPAGMMDDPVYLQDEHVIQRMLASEKRQNIPSYFEQLTINNNNIQNQNQNQLLHYNQLDFTESDRRELAIWMNDVCLAEECQPDIFPLSILIVDRFLNFVQTKRQQLQLLGTVALLLASKLRQTNQIPAKHLIYYTQDLITLQELKTWELFVLTTLKWDLSFITPVDFLDLLLKRLTNIVKEYDEQIISDFEENAHRLIIQCCIDFKHSLYTPSMIAWACLMQAMEPWNKKLNKTKNINIDIYSNVIYPPNMCACINNQQQQQQTIINVTQ